MNLVSLFLGTDGLDLDFKKAGFNIVVTNEHNKKFGKYIKKYKTRLIKEDICNIPSDRFPDCDGVIGGTSCQ